MRLRKKAEKKEKNTFEASMEIDNPDVKIVTASFKKQPFFVGVGVSSKREVSGSGQVDLAKGISGKYQSQKDLDWELFYNPNALPTGFIPIERAKGLMSSAVAATTGSVAVFQPETTFKETSPEKLKGIRKSLARAATLSGRPLTEEEVEKIIESLGKRADV
jgi:hypothetical protein